MNTQEASHLEKATEHVEETIDHHEEEGTGAQNGKETIDSLGHASKPRVDSSSDRVTAKTWMVISVSSIVSKGANVLIFTDLESHLWFGVVANPDHHHFASLHCDRLGRPRIGLLVRVRLCSYGGGRLSICWSEQ
jgi:hypothetical protein